MPPDLSGQNILSPATAHATVIPAADPPSRGSGAKATEAGMAPAGRDKTRGCPLSSSTTSIVSPRRESAAGPLSGSSMGPRRMRQEEEASRGENAIAVGGA